MRRSKKIVLALPMGVPHLDRVVHGIHLYAFEHCNWEFMTSPETHSLPVRSLKGWDGDGAIALVNSQRDLEVVRDITTPVVNISGAIKEANLPRVRLDYVDAGRVAAEHLLNRGFQRFAFYGIKDTWYSELYEVGFTSAIEARGGCCDCYSSISSIGLNKPWKHDTAELEGWLQSLQYPIGLMAVHDPRAAMVTQACRRIGVNVPRDIAVIGANNDTTTCEFCEPPLTSVSRNGEQIGYEAAAMLDRLMRGESVDEDVVIAPGKVVERTSTDVLAIENHDLLRAVRYMHDHLQDPIGVNDICRTISRSRRWLEYELKKTLQCTPHQYLNKIRIDQAKKLLRQPEKLKLKQVAMMCGFANSKQLNIVFKRITSISPREYRKGRD